MADEVVPPEALAHVVGGIPCSAVLAKIRGLFYVDPPPRPEGYVPLGQEVLAMFRQYENPNVSSIHHLMPADPAG